MPLGHVVECPRPIVPPMPLAMMLPRAHARARTRACILARAHAHARARTRACRFARFVIHVDLAARGGAAPVKQAL